MNNGRCEFYTMLHNAVDGTYSMGLCNTYTSLTEPTSEVLSEEKENCGPYLQVTTVHLPLAGLSSFLE